MTPYEALELRYYYRNETASAFRYWVSLTFAVLVAAYVAGEQLNGWTVGIILVLYMMVAWSNNRILLTSSADMQALSEEIITKLGKASILNFVARNSSFVWKGTSPDIREVGRELNVRFVVEGSIRVVGQTLRLNAQLIDTLTGAHIWAEIYDLPRDNPDAALHGVEDVVAGELLAVLRDVEIDRLLKLDDAALTVDNIVALCWGKAVVTSTAEGMQDAIDILRRGLARHAGAAELHAELAHYCCTMGRNFDKENRDDLLQECRAHLEQAIRLEPLGEMSLFRACTVRYLLGEYEESLTAGRLFADLYPDSHAPVHCMPMRVLGHYEETLAVVDPWLATSSKRHIDRRWVLEFKGTALLGLGEFEAAEKVLREAGGEPFRPSAQLPTVVALAHQGKLDEAAKAWSVYQASPGALSPDRLE